MISPWEVPETSRNKFLPGKSLQNDFSFGKSPRPLRIKEVMPLSTTTPPPPTPTFMSTFPSYVFLPTWRVSPSSSNFLETSAGTRDSPRLLQIWPLATFNGKVEEKQNQKKFLAVRFPACWLYLPSNLKSWWQPCSGITFSINDLSTLLDPDDHWGRWERTWLFEHLWFLSFISLLCYQTLHWTFHLG